MIVVIDYNVGNVKSVCNALSHIGCEAKLSCDEGEIESASGIVLPGVAAFGWLPYYPVWGVLFVIASVAVIWALTVHGEDITKY